MSWPVPVARTNASAASSSFRSAWSLRARDSSARYFSASRCSSSSAASPLGRLAGGASDGATLGAALGSALGLGEAEALVRALGAGGAGLDLHAASVNTTTNGTRTNHIGTFLTWSAPKLAARRARGELSSRIVRHTWVIRGLVALATSSAITASDERAAWSKPQPTAKAPAAKAPAAKALGYAEAQRLVLGLINRDRKAAG